MPCEFEIQLVRIEICSSCDTVERITDVGRFVLRVSSVLYLLCVNLICHRNVCKYYVKNYRRPGIKTADF